MYTNQENVRGRRNRLSAARAAEAKPPDGGVRRMREHKITLDQLGVGEIEVALDFGRFSHRGQPVPAGVPAAGGGVKYADDTSCVFTSHGDDLTCPQA